MTRKGSSKKAPTPANAPDDRAVTRAMAARLMWCDQQRPATMIILMAEDSINLVVCSPKGVLVMARPLAIDRRNLNCVISVVSLMLPSDVMLELHIKRFLALSPDWEATSASSRGSERGGLELLYLNSIRRRA